MHPAVVLLVLLTQLVGTHAKRGAHCVHGLCLVLMPGHQIGPVRPGDTIGAEVARIPVRTRPHVMAPAVRTASVPHLGETHLPPDPRRRWCPG
jgi:hypothetical protein